MNINKEILFNVLSNESIETNRLKVFYDWEYPTPEGSFYESDYSTISNSFLLLYNSVYGIDKHLIDLDTSKVSTESMAGVSVGLSHGATTAGRQNSGNGYAQFDGDDIIYITNSSLISNWTVFIDIDQLPCSSNKNKSRILFTNKTEITDTSGFIIGINGANCLFYESSDSDGNKLIKTLIKPLGEKNILAVSRSNDSVNLFVYDPIKNETTLESFSVSDAWSSKNWYIGGPKTNFVSDNNYEKFVGNLNNILLFDLDLSSAITKKIFESFTLTAFTPESYQEVDTQVPKAGQYVERQVEDGFTTDGYEYFETTITGNDGNPITVYNKVPKLIKKYKTVTQYVAGTGTTTKKVRTLIPESKTRDTVNSKPYTEKCILLNKTANKTDKVEIYSRDSLIGESGLKATFGPAQSTFYVNKSYSSAINFIFYLNGLLIEPDVDYQVTDNTHIKKLNGTFVATDVVTYDTYINTKVFHNFFGYNGNILLYGEQGKDVYLNGKKLIWGVDYNDYSSNYLIIYAAGLSAGRLGLITRPTNIANNSNFTNKFYNCDSYNIVDEQVWINGLRSIKDTDYSLTCSCNLNNSNNDKSEEKTTIIYNNEGNYFNI